MAFQSLCIKCLKEWIHFWIQSKHIISINTDKKAPTAKTDAKKKSPAKAKSEPKSKSKQPKEPEKSEPKVEAKEKSASTQPNMSEAQKRAIYNLSRRRGISVEELEQMAMDAYSVSVENLNSKDASSFIRNLQQAAWPIKFKDWSYNQ